MALLPLETEKVGASTRPTGFLLPLFAKAAYTPRRILDVLGRGR